MVYDHPKAVDGVDSHRFHRENMVKVAGHIASPTEVGVATELLSSSANKFSIPLTEEDQQVLKAVGVKPILGLPLADEGVYVEQNSLFLANGLDTVDRTAVSFPDAGRAVSLREGWVVGNRLFVDHDVKGIGKTKSVTFDHIHKPFEPGSGVGISMDVSTDLTGSDGAVKLDILVPEILPPIVLDELVREGQRINAAEYHDGDTLFCIGRCWSSDVRVSNMYPGFSSFLTVRDLRWIGEHRDVIRKVFESRVNGYLGRAKVVNEFNSVNGTAYDIGCGNLLDGDYSYENYSRAFRYRLIDNVAKMVGADYYHLNCSPQNTSVAAELGDWDRYGYVNADGHWVAGDGIVLTDPEVVNVYRADATYRVVMDSYKTQAVIDAVLGNDFVDVNQYWNLIREQLPEGHWAKEMLMDDIVMSILKEADKGKEWAQEQVKLNRRSVELWSNEFRQLSEK